MWLSLLKYLTPKNIAIALSVIFLIALVSGLFYYKNKCDNLAAVIVDKDKDIATMTTMLADYDGQIKALKEQYVKTEAIKKESQKLRDRINNLYDSCECTTIESGAIPKGEEKCIKEKLFNEKIIILFNDMYKFYGDGVLLPKTSDSTSK